MLHTKTTPDVVVHFINAVVEKLGLTHFYLAGNSLGGYLSWNYTLHYPTKVKKLILIDSAGYAKVAPLAVVLMRGKGIRHLTKHVAPLPFIIQSVRSAYADSSRIPKGTIRRYQDLLLGQSRYVFLLAKMRLKR
ncbi:MAG: alpha/beta fold hydrolase [Moraxellaceae bacterium]|nr:alpha/beta fold hydrolase [Moraxellaceae bacterium]